ncbi:hypothetical protein IWX90DRAFT_439570 [Phyllosticta citrichinensis]|uniref:Uncharacterized protein n=1 Tax=Phyllosticta citrichinensis TaxID=1130410 RepID=A0ABR1XPJ7_9PEZI
MSDIFAMAMEFSISSISWSLRRDCKEFAPQLVQQVEALHIASRDFEDASFLPQPDTPLRTGYELLVGRCYANLQELEGLVNYRRQSLRRGDAVAAESTAVPLQRLMPKLLENAQAFRGLQEAIEAAVRPLEHPGVASPPVSPQVQVTTANIPVSPQESPIRLQPYAETVVESEDEPFEIVVPVETEPTSPVSPVQKHEGPNPARERSTASQRDAVRNDMTNTSQNSTTERQERSGPRATRRDEPSQRPRRKVTSDGQSTWSSAADCGNVEELSNEPPTDHRRRLARRAKNKEKSTQELHAEIRREEAAQHTRFQQPLDNWQPGRSWFPPPTATYSLPQQFQAPSPYLDSSALNPGFAGMPYPYQYAAQYTAYPFRPGYPTAAEWQHTYQQHPYPPPGSPAPPTSVYNPAPNSGASGRCNCASRPESDRVFYVDGKGTCHVCLHW